MSVLLRNTMTVQEIMICIRLIVGEVSAILIEKRKWIQA